MHTIKRIKKGKRMQCENTIDEQVYKILKDKAEFDEELWFKGEYK